MKVPGTLCFTALQFATLCFKPKYNVWSHMVLFHNGWWTAVNCANSIQLFLSRCYWMFGLCRQWLYHPISY